MNNLGDVGFDSERTKEIRKARAIYDSTWLASFLLILIINIVLFSIGFGQSEKYTSTQAASVLVLFASGALVPIGLIVYVIKRKGYSKRLKIAVQIDYEDFVRERMKQRDKYKEEDEKKKDSIKG